MASTSKFPGARDVDTFCSAYCGGHFLVAEAERNTRREASHAASGTEHSGQSSAEQSHDEIVSPAA